jgi:hypothetical protein
MTVACSTVALPERGRPHSASGGGGGIAFAASRRPSARSDAGGVDRVCVVGAAAAVHRTRRHPEHCERCQSPRRLHQ